MQNQPLMPPPGIGLRHFGYGRVLGVEMLSENSGIPAFGTRLEDPNSWETQEI